VFPERGYYAADPFLAGVTRIFVAQDREMLVLKSRPFHGQIPPNAKKLGPSNKPLGLDLVGPSTERKTVGSIQLPLGLDLVGPALERIK
jgi:hypothetical protein